MSKLSFYLKTFCYVIVMIFFCLGVKVFLEELGVSEFYNWLISCVILPVLFLIYSYKFLDNKIKSTLIEKEDGKEVKE